MTTTPKRLELDEWGRGTCAGVTLNAADIALAERLRKRPSAARVEVRRYGDVIDVQASGAVGVVRFEQLEVRVRPKLAEGHLGLVQLIQFLGGMGELASLEAIRDLDLAGASLVELTAFLLVEATDAVVRQGLWADYVEREEDLPVVRGRLLLDRQWRHRYGMLDRLECRFDEHELDIRENRLLGVALEAGAPLLSHPAVAGRAAALAELFEGVCDLAAEPREGLVEPFSYHRMNDHYADAHELARLVLDGLGPDDVLASGDASCFAFLIDMNNLFERFVERLLALLLRDADFRIEAQRQDSIVRRAQNSKRYGFIRPDILLTSRADRRRLAVDSKWKRYDARKVDSGDIAQMFLYAYAYARPDASPAALLMYPTETAGLVDTPLVVRTVENAERARISVVGVPVCALLGELADGADGTPSLDALRTAVESVLGGVPA
jgi:5-methylcytosine-specific restriction enzyme subunit McrC